MVVVLHVHTTNHPYDFDLLVTRELVPSLNVETKFIEIHPATLLMQPNKVLLHHKKYLCMQSSSFSLLTFFMSLREPLNIIFKLLIYFII